MLDLEPYYSVARSLGAAAGGALVTFGVLSVGDAAAAGDAFGHILNGVKELSVGIGALAVPAATVWGYLSHRPGAVLASAQKIPDVKQIVVHSSAPATDPAAVAAADTKQPKVVFDNVARELGR